MSIYNQVVPTPVQIPQHQHHGLMNGNINAQIYNLPGTSTQGADLLTHLEMSIKAKLQLDWCTRTLLSFSNSAAYLVAHRWVLDYLLDVLAEVSTDENIDPVQIHSKGKDCALILRNLVQDDQFTKLLVNGRTEKVLYNILKNFEKNATTRDGFDNEFLFYAVEIVESVSSYYAPCAKDDELFLVLVKIFQWNNDRSLLISIMRSFARFLVRSQIGVESCADNLNSAIIDKIVSFLLVNDYDLLLTSLDFLYQFTLPGNDRIVYLLKSVTRKDILKSRLIQLLSYQQSTLNNPNDISNLKPLKLVKRTKPPVPTSAPKLSSTHYSEISQLNEPLRATAWMRSCYRANPDGEVTQISLWKSYESQFENEVLKSKKKLLPAVDFIKNVNQAFTGSNAMVINLNNGQRKFIIKGIEPRFNSVDKRTADFEAFNPTSVSNSNNQDINISADAQQEPLPTYRPPTKLNEVNKSSALLLASLMNNEVGKEIFSLLQEDIFGKIIALPGLMDEIGGVI